MNNDLTPLLHAIGTAQVLNDEIDVLSSKDNRLSYYKQELKQATNNWRKVALKQSGVNSVLSQIWEAVPQDDFDEYLKAKKRLIRRVSNSSFEDIRELDYQLSDVKAKYKMLEVFEKMLNTHCLPIMREKYREELGYTEAQYLELKKTHTI